MYVADDLKRINASEIKEIDATCDYCDMPAVENIPIYNPADGVRGIEGAYAILNLCNEHLYDIPDFGEEYFVCESCGEYFVTHHSWDYLAVRLEDGLYCQKCAIEQIEPVTIAELLSELQDNDTSLWTRVNNIPGKDSLWEGEFSQWSDFPGYTSLLRVRDDIKVAMEEHGLSLDSKVYPILSATYQFSVVLEVLIA